LFIALFSCENQDLFTNFASIETNIEIDKSSQIKLNPTILSKKDIDEISCGEDFITTLYAGQHIDIGTITVSNNEMNLFVTYEVNGNWWLSESHLYVGSKDEIPITDKGNPKIGHFPYHGDHDLTQTYTFTIPLANLDDCFVIISHASTVKKENGENVSSETAFGFGNNEFEGNRWGWYSDYCKKDCDDDNGDKENSDDEDGNDDDDDDDDDENNDNRNNDGNDDYNSISDCMDTFAYKKSNSDESYCFLNDGFTQWGWSNEFLYNKTINYQENYTYQFPLYVKAEGCDLTNSIEVGYVKIYISGGDGRMSAKVDYVITDTNYKLSEVNLYVGETRYPKDANDRDTVLPADYTYSKYNIETTNYSFENVTWPIDTYIIPYAKVCPVGSVN